MRDISVGTDSENYSGIFESYGDDISDVYHVSEPLYLLLQFFVAIMGWDYNSLMFLTSAIVIVGIYTFALLESKRPNMVILCFYLLYYYFYAINTIRQYDAMVFILLAWHFQRIKKYIKIDTVLVERFIVWNMMKHTPIEERNKLVVAR